MLRKLIEIGCDIIVLGSVILMLIAGIVYIGLA
jgi:hypothetical protein